MDLVGWQEKLEALDPSKIELGLERVQTVFDSLDLNLDFKTILVAGTNGKGSAVAVLEALLLTQGHRVGAYTSPHLQHFNERARFQAEAAQDADLIAAFELVEKNCNGIALTYFEFTTLAAIAYFSKLSLDYGIFEVGLGGRLDAVNILDADISIITGVALDHTEWLGPDKESIGFEKAGIYRAGTPAIYASRDIPSTVRQRIEDISAQPFLFGDQIGYENKNSLISYRVDIPAKGEDRLCIEAEHLPAPSILAAVATYRLLGFELGPKVAETISCVQVPGRFQRAQLEGASLILDVAHNSQASEYLADRLARQNVGAKPAAIFGVMDDKPVEEILAPITLQVESWYLVKPDNPRAASLQKIRQILLEKGVDEENIFSVGPIVDLAPVLKKITAAVVFGSFYTVGEFLNHFGDRLD